MKYIVECSAPYDRTEWVRSIHSDEYSFADARQRATDLEKHSRMGLQYRVTPVIPPVEPNLAPEEIIVVDLHAARFVLEGK